MIADLLSRKRTHFIFWRPGAKFGAPMLVIGSFQPGVPPSMLNVRRFALTPVPALTGLWELAAAATGLVDGVYHYWFEAPDTHPTRTPGTAIECTDPAAYTVNWNLLGSAPAGNRYGERDRQPAAVIKLAAGQLVACDVGGETGALAGDAPRSTRPANRQLVIYELPTAWTRIDPTGSLERGVGTFQDVLALVDAPVPGANFSDLPVLQPGRAYLTELGINALELLPAADSAYYRQWGYGTTNFFAPDWELGLPLSHSWSTSTRDLSALVRACHAQGIRFFVDAVLAFAREGPYETLDFPTFHIACPGENQNDPDALTSTRASGQKEVRNGFGSRLFRYAQPVTAYDPVSGANTSMVPARQLMLTALERWMRDFGIDGIRMDSVENIANWDFIEAFTTHGHQLWRELWNAEGLGAGADDRFLVVGEELSVPLDILQQNRLDGLWNDPFRAFIRAALIGRNADTEPSFEWTVRKAMDPRLLGFANGSQAVNYVTSHDVEGYRRERLFNFFQKAGVTDIERRMRLAFVCLLTAVGIPMILAGEEFADQHDRFDADGHVTQDGGKQVDPVNFSRLNDAWRHRLFRYVARLVALRTTHSALHGDDIRFIHVDFDDDKRVVVWQRGPQADPIVVVANFSDFATPSGPAAEYVIPNWPATAPGRSWREETQDRPVPPAWIGREPIFQWEAKVYRLA